MYLSRTIWVFWFKLFHIMPMPYHWFKNKWKTLILIIYIKLLVQTILLLVQRDYIKTTLKIILCTKITTIVRFSRCKYYMGSKIWDIAWVSKFKKISDKMDLTIQTRIFNNVIGSSCNLLFEIWIHIFYFSNDVRSGSKSQNLMK